MVSSYSLLAAVALAALSAVQAQNTTCPDYSSYSTEKHTPYSSGAYQLSYMRPVSQCRTFVSAAVDQTIAKMQNKIKDPDLYRLFQNSCKGTLSAFIACSLTNYQTPTPLTQQSSGRVWPRTTVPKS